MRRYEMLLRIIDEKGRLVLPGHFMSSATRYQLLPQIDRCVVSARADAARHGERAARVRAAARFASTCPARRSATRSLPEWLLVQIDSSGVPGDWLTFELTETAAVNNLEHAQMLMDRLGERGCRFALDDFGTGLSSLAHLKALKFSMLKIDGSFIRDILHNERSQSLVRAVSQLAHAHGHGDRRGVRRDARDLHAADRAGGAVRPGLRDRSSAAARRHSCDACDSRDARTRRLGRD